MSMSMTHDDLIAAVVITALMGMMALAKQDLSIKTETIDSTNRTTKTVVFRAAKDMGSTNKVNGCDLKNNDKIKNLKDKLKTKDKDV